MVTADSVPGCECTYAQQVFLPSSSKPWAKEPPSDLQQDHLALRVRILVFKMGHTRHCLLKNVVSTRPRSIPSVQYSPQVVLARNVWLAPCSGNSYIVIISLHSWLTLEQISSPFERVMDWEGCSASGRHVYRPQKRRKSNTLSCRDHTWAFTKPSLINCLPGASR